MLSSLLLLTLAVSAVLTAPLQANEDECEVVWVTADSGVGSPESILALVSSSFSQPSATQTPGGSSSVSSGGYKGSESSQPSSLGNGQPDSSGESASTEAGNGSSSSSSSNTGTGNAASSSSGNGTGTTINAPDQTDTAPEGAETYTPQNTKFNMNDFNNWLKNRTAAKTASKWLVVKPGAYEMYVDQTADGFNQDIEIAGLREDNSGWTFDFRDCTFTYTTPPPETSGNPPSAIYVAQSTQLRILGGTFWINAGELYSQGVITSLESADATNTAINKVTFTIDEGYNMSAWAQVDYTKLYFLDTSNPGHYVRPKTTFWGDNPKWTVDLSARTVSATVNGIGYEKGMAVSVSTGIGFPTAVSLEMDSEVTVKGLTSNGGFFHYGLYTDELPGENRQVSTWQDCLITNPPASNAGMRKSVNGPTLSALWSGKYDSTVDNAPPAKVVNSFWQNSGCTKDLSSLTDSDAPTS